MFLPRLAIVASAALALVACDTSAPYSNVIDTTGRGVGFSDYAQYMRAQEELARIRQANAAPMRPTGAPTAAPQYSQTQSIGQDAVAAVRGEPVSQPAQAPAGAPLSAVQPQSAPASAAVSTQAFEPQPFGTPQQNRVVQRDHVPQVRVSADELAQGSGPNLFVYALSTQHSVGEQRFRRSHPMRWRRWEAACAQFANQDLAQEAFLAAGGPEQDPNHMDPDGDGFACWWDPTPFRQAARTARARE